MTTTEVTRHFKVTVDKAEVSKGTLVLIVSEESPPKTWLKDFRMTDNLDSFALLDNEANAVISAVITGKDKLPIRNGNILLEITTSESEMD